MHGHSGGGTFMDGGSSQNHGGHFNHGGGDSFQQGHDAVHCDHGHFAHDGAHEGGLDGGHHHGAHGHIGGEEAKGGLGGIFGLGQGHNHNFLAHLLGLDHDIHHAHMHGSAGQQQGHHGSITYEIPFWAVALQSVKFSSIFQGMRLSPANWMCLMFFGFIAWLFTISWVRHHEAFTNQMLGTTLPRQAVARNAWGQSTIVNKPSVAVSHAPITGSAGSAAATVLSAPLYAPIAPTPAPPAPPPVPKYKGHFIWPTNASLRPSMSSALTTTLSPALSPRSNVYRSPLAIQNPRVKTIIDR